VIARARRRGPWALVGLALIVAGVALLVTLAVFAANGTQEPSVRGLITGVTARDIGHAETLIVRAENGREFRFQVADAVDMTPGHLREHMTFAEPVTVYYRREGDTLLALRVTD
jgi:hypothetical protein